VNNVFRIQEDPAERQEKNQTQMQHHHLAVSHLMTMKVMLFRITAAQLSPSLNKHETFIINVRAFDLPERV